MKNESYKWKIVVICLCMLFFIDSCRDSERIKNNSDLLSDDNEYDTLIVMLGDESKQAQAESKLLQALNESKEKRKKTADVINESLNNICGDGISNEYKRRQLKNILNILKKTKPEESYDVLVKNIGCGPIITGSSPTSNPVLSILPEFGDAIIPQLKHMLINGTVEERMKTVIVLSQINSNQAQKLLNEIYEKEKNEEIRKIIEISLQK